jgi:hypothetical protein
MRIVSSVLLLALCGCARAPVPVPTPPIAPPIYPFVATGVWTSYGTAGTVNPAFFPWRAMYCTPDPVLNDGVTYDCQ